jgi:hypothetical protein
MPYIENIRNGNPEGHAMTRKTLNPMIEVVRLAMTAKADPVNPKMYLSCARVYVSVYGKHKRNVMNACKKLGITWSSYRSGIYVGYDNATGFEYMRGEAIARALKVFGVECYQHCDED